MATRGNSDYNVYFIASRWRGSYCVLLLLLLPTVTVITEFQYGGASPHHKFMNLKIRKYHFE